MLIGFVITCELLSLSHYFLIVGRVYVNLLIHLNVKNQENISEIPEALYNLLKDNAIYE